MEPLYDRLGRVRAWLHAEHARIISLQGSHLASIDGHSVYDSSGQHIGWWKHGHMRNTRGAVVVWASDAFGLGVIRPPQMPPPAEPEAPVVEGFQARATPPAHPARSASWAVEFPF
ncbi:4-fold beta flower protein [Rhodoplanes azumiensis]|uniref:4-fold beta flower protein n=1 Tax=Rhodoplanes azumiensis TaxID=1897628 RepID=A0ABW5AMU1_9BRAD